MAGKKRQAFPAAPSPEAATEGTQPRPGGLRRAPMFAKGAASLDNALKSAAAEERMYRHLPVAAIDPSPIRDRIDLTEDLDVLIQSLRRDGQQIPILVRPRPGTDRYEIVTGRRRLEAMRALGRDTIQAFVRPLSDEEAFVAQGVENNARLETSFIERARTVLSALEAGFTQTQVESFLAVDQTMVSRMKTIYQGLGDEIVLAIGPARGVGRRKWERLQKLVEGSGLDRATLAASVAKEGDSVARFDAFLARMETATPPAPPPARRNRDAAPARALAEGRLLARRSSRQMVLKLDRTMPEDFLDFLEDRLPGLVADYERTRKG